MLGSAALLVRVRFLVLVLPSFSVSSQLSGASSATLWPRLFGCLVVWLFVWLLGMCENNADALAKKKMEKLARAPKTNRDKFGAPAATAGKVEPTQPGNAATATVSADREEVKRRKKAAKVLYCLDLGFILAISRVCLRSERAVRRALRSIRVSRMLIGSCIRWCA